MIKRILNLCCAALLLSRFISFAVPVDAAVPYQTPVTAESIAGIIDHYRQQIPARMQQENVSGLAIVVVDDQNVLWAEGFGYTDWDRTTPVTTDTLFSIQSMSKSFTATAAMFAAQDGLVDLDAPITTYLPDFRIHSVFEEHPEQQITLRLLLSHTAGLVHEAPIGGNNDLPGHTFEEHVASISDTWLKFPVGTRYSYSNLGVDLAGYILQVRSGMPITQYVKEKLFVPLAMNASTLDTSQVRATQGRAFGHMDSPLPPPAEMLIIPSGGVWTTANDIARYLRFHINGGALDGARLLRQDLAETMYTPPNKPALYAGYALGIAYDENQNTRRFQHGGGGFGFNSNMEWYPELKLGAVVLTNYGNTKTLWQLTTEILNSIINTNIPLYHARASDRPAVEPAYGLDLNGPSPLGDTDLGSLIASKALPLDDATRQRRQALAGDYLTTTFGFPGVTAQVKDDNGALTGMVMGRTFPLTEVKPGLFFDPQGMAYDLFQSPASAPNNQLVKFDPRLLPFLLGIYGLCGLVFLSTLVLWPLRAIVRRIRRRKASPEAVPGAPAPNERRWPSLNALVAVLAGLASLLSLLCLGVVALLPDMIYLPWPRPWVDLSWWQYTAFLLPFASLLLAAAAAAVAISARPQAQGTPLRIYYAVVALALAGFNLALIF